MTALDSLLRTVSPRRTDPGHDECWKAGCSEKGTDRLGMCPPHFEQFREEES